LQVEWDEEVRIERHIELLDVFLGSISVGGKEDKE
jgi:hypothetical protein